MSPPPVKVIFRAIVKLLPGAVDPENELYWKEADCALVRTDPAVTAASVAATSTTSFFMLLATTRAPFLWR
jgi:hypothetical protein